MFAITISSNYKRHDNLNHQEKSAAKDVQNAQLQAPKIPSLTKEEESQLASIRKNHESLKDINFGRNVLIYDLVCRHLPGSRRLAELNSQAEEGVKSSLENFESIKELHKEDFEKFQGILDSEEKLASVLKRADEKLNSKLPLNDFNEILEIKGLLATIKQPLTRSFTGNIFEDNEIIERRKATACLLLKKYGLL